MSVWKSCIYFVNFLLVFDFYLTFKLFYVVYILVGFNHVSMVMIRPYNGLGWRFPAISLWAIIV